MATTPTPGAKTRRSASGSRSAANRRRSTSSRRTASPSTNGLLFLVADMLPATVPLGIAAALVFALERRNSRPRRRAHRRVVLAPFPPRSAAESSLS